MKYETKQFEQKIYSQLLQSLRFAVCLQFIYKNNDYFIQIAKCVEVARIYDQNKIMLELLTEKSSIYIIHGLKSPRPNK